MKVLYICILLFCINLGAVMVYNTNIFDAVGMNVNTTGINEVSSFANQNYGQIIRDNDGRTPAETDYIKALSWMDQLFMILLPHYTLQVIFGLPWSVAMLISAPIYIFYLIALAQFLRNFSGDGAM